MTRDQIADLLRINLEDGGITYYSADDVNDSIQDGYDDIAVVSGCIQKSADVDFIDNLTYYNFSVLISDYYTVVAIYNNTQKRWMDPTDRREMNTLRRDWETITGQPSMFFPMDSRRVMVMPRMVVASGNMTVFYRATAPTLAGGDTPLIHVDEQKLLEWYATGDLFDQAEEYIKAEIWWSKYF